MKKSHISLSGAALALLAIAGCSSPAQEAVLDLSTGPTDAAGSTPADLAGGSLSALSDEFAGAQLSGWTDLFPTLHRTLSQAGGRLSLEPVSVDQTHWFSDQRGPLLYKLVSGNFVVETDVRVGRQSDLAQAPRGQFSAGGFVLRDPRSTAPAGERWVMYNVGYQVSGAAREAKTTRPGNPASLSTLYLMNSGGVLSGRLRVCRLGSTLHFFHQLTGEASFVEEAYTAGTSPMGNGAAEATPGVVQGGVIRFDRPDLPSTLQVGLIAGNWAAPYETRAEFEYVRFASTSTLADCTRPLP
jgi:hypothetical protein